MGDAITPSLKHEGLVAGAQVFADDTRILTWSYDGTARVWDARSGDAITPPLKHEDLVAGAKVFADDTRILTWRFEGTARVWSVDVVRSDGFLEDYEVATGTRLDSTGEVRTIPPAEWRALKERRSLRPSSSPVAVDPSAQLR